MSCTQRDRAPSLISGLAELSPVAVTDTRTAVWYTGAVQTLQWRARVYPGGRGVASTLDTRTEGYTTLPMGTRYIRLTGRVTLEARALAL